MFKKTISMKLFRTLRKGKEQLGKEALGRINDFVRSQRADNGSFVNKSGEPDLYYTVFGWTLSYILGIKSDAIKSGTYLESLNTTSLDLVHYAAYIRCRLIGQLAQNGKTGVWLNTFIKKQVPTRKEFISVPHNDPQSPYTQFLRLSLLEDTGCKIGNRQGIHDSLTAYRADSGGYRNTIDGFTASTNATVAALIVNKQLEYGDDNIRYLQGIQHTTGGFGATQASPVPDMLSTATALFTLKDYGIKPNHPAREFIEAHWLDNGGFAATLMEDISDIEYTFYGLLALGAISNK